MGAPDSGLPEIVYTKEDGSLFTRREMEEKLRVELKSVYWLRLFANKKYGLTKQYVFTMVEVVLRHWLLDEMIRQGKVVGDVIGVNLQSHADEAEMRQFIQRLAAMIQTGQALTPKEGEGITDMSNVPQTPPGMPPNGQSQAAVPYAPPPPPPMGAPQQAYAPPGPGTQYAPPAPPSGPPAQQFAPPPGAVPQSQTYAPPAPPAGPPGFVPQAGPGGFAPPVGPPGGFQPQAGPPMTPPGPPAAPPAGVPQAAAPAATGPGRGRRRAAPAEGAPAQQAAPPPAQGASMPMPTQQFAPAGGMPMPMPGGVAQPTFPQQAQPMPQSNETSPMVAEISAVVAQQIGPLVQLIQQQGQEIAQLRSQLALVDMGIAVQLRVAYGKQGQPDLGSAFRDIGIQLPQ